jgi:hypothetical protein
LAYPLRGFGRGTAQAAAKPLEIGFVYESVGAARIPKANVFLKGLLVVNMSST